MKLRLCGSGFQPRSSRSAAADSHNKSHLHWKWVMVHSAMTRFWRSRHNRWLRKKAKVKARALTTTRRAGGLDFRPKAEKTKARQCLQRYVCDSKQSRGVRRTCSTPQRQRDEAQRRNWTIYAAIEFIWDGTPGKLSVRNWPAGARVSGVIFAGRAPWPSCPCGSRYRTCGRRS